MIIYIFLSIVIVFSSFTTALEGGCGLIDNYQQIGQIDITGLKGAPENNCTFDSAIGFPYAHIQSIQREGCYLIENGKCHINAVYVVREQAFPGYTRCETVLGSVGLAIDIDTFQGEITSQYIARNVYNNGGLGSGSTDVDNFFRNGCQKNVFYGDSTFIYTNPSEANIGVLTYCNGTDGTITDHNNCNTMVYADGPVYYTMRYDGIYSRKRQLYLSYRNGRFGGLLHVFDLNDFSRTTFNVGLIRDAILFDQEDILVCAT